MIEFIDSDEIFLLIRLIVAHLLADFVFQKDSWVKDRYNNGWYSKYLYLHGLIAGLLVYIFSYQWSGLWLLVVVAISHVVIDGLKIRKNDNITMFLLDQLGHLTVLLFVWLLIIDLSLSEIFSLDGFLLSGIEFWIIILAYIIVIWPAGIIIEKATAQWRKEINSENDMGLTKAGMWIGRLERILILTFVLIDQYQAVGLLIAAKSIFRFNQDLKMGEYFLIGSLISFVIAITIGLFVGYLIN